MKRIFASLGWLLLLLPFISVAGTKTIINSVYSKSFNTQNRNVSSFHGVASGGSFDVYIKMGSTETLKLVGDEDDIQDVETEVEDGILKIHFKKRASSWGWNNRGKVKVYITAKKLKSLTVSGSGDMEVDGVIRAEQLDVKVSGSGNIGFKAAAQTLNATISGSGEIATEGSAQKANISISGSGEFNGEKFRTSTTDIKVSGSGSAKIHTEKALNAVVSGSGDILYSGNPTVNQKKSGSGKVSRL